MEFVSKAKEVSANLNALSEGATLKGTVKIFVTDREGNDVGIMDLYSDVQIGRGMDEDSFLNKSLDTAKIIFSKLAAGKSEYKIARIAFGNAGHNFVSPKIAVDPSEADVELNALSHIRDSIEAGVSSDYFTYSANGTKYRMAYIEKEIVEAQHIRYGEDGNQFIVRVPISYDEFNYRIGGDSDMATNFDPSLISYDYIDTNGDLVKMGECDSTGTPVGGATFTEVHATTGTPVNFLFKNGLDSNGDVDTNGGTRPQEISEILLLADVIGDGTPGNEYKKYAASRMTSGLLSFPEGFQFTYEWTLTWNFS